MEAKTEITIPHQAISLQRGERYAGIILGGDGMPGYHLVLLPGEADDIKFEAAHVVAKQMGGGLPNRWEQALLFANLLDEFTGGWYWSGVDHDYKSDYAWCMDFGNGFQTSAHKNSKLRVRAVRRVPFERYTMNVEMPEAE